MIGDWISCGGRNLRINEIGGMFCLDAVEDLFAALEDVEPIPLTPEILEKNGFRLSQRDAEHAFFKEWEGHKFEIEIKKSTNCGKVLGIKLLGNTGYAIKSYNMPLPIYVHTLQHALKLCGIEKTIEL